MRPSSLELQDNLIIFKTCSFWKKKSTQDGNCPLMTTLTGVEITQLSGVMYHMTYLTSSHTWTLNHHFISDPLAHSKHTVRTALNYLYQWPWSWTKYWAPPPKQYPRDTMISFSALILRSAVVCCHLWKVPSKFTGPKFQGSMQAPALSSDDVCLWWLSRCYKK